jgi:anti-anti-sigma factor
MDISTTDKDGVTVATFVGRLDTNTAPAAQEKLDGLVDGGATKLLIDFSALDYISSAGLRVLLATAKKMKKSNGTMRLCGLNETVQEIFDVSGFSTMLSVFGTQDEALAGF